MDWHDVQCSCLPVRICPGGGLELLLLADCTGSAGTPSAAPGASSCGVIVGEAGRPASCRIV